MTSHANVAELVMGAMVGHALLAVTSLEIPDLLRAGPMSAAALAETSGANRDGLQRVLSALVAAGFFRTEGERYVLTDLGMTLTSGHPTAAREMVLGLLGPLFNKPMQLLSETIRTGENGMQLAFGMDLFDYLAENEQRGRVFDRLMLSVHGDEPAAVSEAWALPNSKQVVDVGGGAGTLLRAVLQRMPAARGILFDTPEVVAGVASDGDSDRMTTLGGDFFDSVPTGADIYLLSHIVHDWDDEAAGRILSNCREAMASGGRVILVEMVLPDDDAPHPGKIFDVLMLSVGGRERTAQQYRQLLASSGLELMRVVPTRSAVSIIEAVAPVPA